MKMTMTIKYRNGQKEIRDYPTVGKWHQEYTNILANQRSDVKCVWVEPTNKPWERERIDL